MLNPSEFVPALYGDTIQAHRSIQGLLRQGVPVVIAEQCGKLRQRLLQAAALGNGGLNQLSALPTCLWFPASSSGTNRASGILTVRHWLNVATGKQESSFSQWTVATTSTVSIEPGTAADRRPWPRCWLLQGRFYVSSLSGYCVPIGVLCISCLDKEGRFLPRIGAKQDRIPTRSTVPESGASEWADDDNTRLHAV